MVAEATARRLGAWIRCPIQITDDVEKRGVALFHALSRDPPMRSTRGSQSRPFAMRRG